MSTPLERTVEQYLIKKCKERGYWTAKFNSAARAGVPDRICAVPRATGADIHFLEIKKDGAEATKLQAWTHADMQKYGMNVQVLAGRAEVDQWIAEVSK